MTKSIVWTLPLAAILLLGGCASKEIDLKYASEYLQPNAGPPAIEVYVIGVDDANIQKFEEMSVEDFFQPGPNATLRTYAEDNHIARSLTFSEDHPLTKEIKKDDPIRATWKNKGARHLIIVQNYPRTIKDAGPARRDSRFLELPLDDGRWDGESLIISIGNTGPYCESGTH